MENQPSSSTAHQLLSYQGDINNDVLKSLMGGLEKKLLELKAKRFVVKKINSVIIEIAQNVIRHSAVADSDAKQILLKVSKIAEGTQVESSNLVEPRAVSQLEQYLSRLNAMDKETLRALYREKMENNEISEKGGAGLGFLNVIRKTKDQQLHYQFQEFSQEYRTFTVKVVV